MSYLRNRPFMIISYSRTPVAGTKTQVAGWAQDEDAAWDANENMVIVDRISNKQMTESDIIIDLLNSTIVKNRHGGSDATVVQGFVGRYRNEVKTAIARWIKDAGGSMEVVRELAGTTEEPTEAPEENKEDQ